MLQRIVSASICQKLTSFSSPSPFTILLISLFTYLYLSKLYKTTSARIELSLHPFSSIIVCKSFTLTSSASKNLCTILQNSIFFPINSTACTLSSTINTIRPLTTLIFSISPCTYCHFLRLTFLQTILDQTDTSSRSNITSPFFSSEARAVRISIKKWAILKDCLTMMAGLEMLFLLFGAREHLQLQAFCPCRKELSDAVTIPFHAKFKVEVDLHRIRRRVRKKCLISFLHQSSNEERLGKQVREERSKESGCLVGLSMMEGEMVGFRDIRVSLCCIVDVIIIGCYS